MQSRHWTDSTESQVGCSGGVSPANYTTRWVPGPSIDDEAAVFQFRDMTDAGHFDVTFRPHVVTEGRYRIPLSLVPRMLCHAIVNRLPDEGLPELCETLGHMFEFYSSRRPAERLIHEEATKVQIVAHEERPPFFLMEEG